MDLPPTTPTRAGTQSPQAPSTPAHAARLRSYGTVLIALVPAVITGTILFGIAQIAALSLVVGITAGSYWALHAALRKEKHISIKHVILWASLLAMTFPPHCSQTVAIVGSILLVLCILLTGYRGQYLWHPVLIARVGIAILFPDMIAERPPPVLDRNHLLLGRLSESAPREYNIHWSNLEVEPGQEAWSNPVQEVVLSSAYHHSTASGIGEERLLHLIRDRLVPTGDCILGTLGGYWGMTCIAAILLGGVFLIYRRYVFATLPLFGILGAFAAASILPIFQDLPTQPHMWLPVRAYIPGVASLPVGFLFVCYHVLTGGLVFSLFMVASDPLIAPRSSRGNAWYGLGIGSLTVTLRYVGLVPGAVFWAILIMNTLVPVINYITRPRRSQTEDYKVLTQT